MDPREQERFGSIPVTLRDGSQAVVRPLAIDDGERLGDLYEALDEHARRFYWPHELDREHARLNAAEADSPCRVVLVLETANGELGGYAWYRWREPDAEASHFGICIRPGGQSRGAGRALMTRLLRIADEVGPPIMRLTCQHANFRAVQLYRRMGFEITREGVVGARRGFAAEPQYWMERRRKARASRPASSP